MVPGSGCVALCSDLKVIRTGTGRVMSLFEESTGAAGGGGGCGLLSSSIGKLSVIDSFLAVSIIALRLLIRSSFGVAWREL